MKRKDIVLIVVVVIFSAVTSLLVSNLFIGSTSNRQEKVEVVEKITADFQQPDTKYFNSNSINPTKVITIGTDKDPKLFKN